MRGGRKPWLELHGNNPGQDEVDTMVDLPGVVEYINGRLARGEKP